MLRKIIENPKEKLANRDGFDIKEDLFPSSTLEVVEKRKIIFDFQQAAYDFYKRLAVQGIWDASQELLETGFYEGWYFDYPYSLPYDRRNEELKIINDYLKEIGKPFQVEQGKYYDHLAFRLVNNNEKNIVQPKKSLPPA